MDPQLGQGRRFKKILGGGAKTGWCHLSGVYLQFYSLSNIFTTFEKTTIKWIKLCDASNPRSQIRITNANCNITVPRFFGLRFLKS